jgi:hypothetical protein
MITLTELIVDINDQTIKFKGHTKEKIKSILFYYQQIKEYKHPKITIESPVLRIGSTFSGKISLDEIYKKMIPNASTTWNLVAIGKSSTFQVDVDEELLKSAGVINVLPLLNLSLDKKDTLQMKFNFVSIKAKIDTFLTTNKQTSITGHFETNMDLLVGHNLSLQVMRRPNISLYNFHEEKFDFPIDDFQSDKQFTIDLNWDLLPESFFKDDTNVCDLVIRMSNEYGHEVTSFLELSDQFTKETVEKKVELSKSVYVVKPYITGSKRLSIYTIKNNKNQIDLVSFSESEDYFKLELSRKNSNTNSKNKQLLLKRKDKKGSAFEYLVGMSWNEVEDYLFTIPKESFMSIPGIIHTGSWEFFLREDEVDYYIMVPDSLKVESDYIYVQDQNYKAKVHKSPGKALSCYTIISDKPSSNAINVAVMGTCFSRNMFNSGLYFNPGYKQVLNCSFTQFHSSIISVMTEPFQFDLDKYTDMTSSERNFVKEDFAKNFFENLKNSNADYFLIDLYPDVIRPVLWVTDKSAITLSYVIEDSELLNDLPVKRLVDHIDNNEFYNEWTKYADAFIEKLTEIIPPERIILNKGRFTTLYYDKDRKKTEFPNKMMIERNNYFWDKLDNYFYSKIPNAQILDIRQKPYIGDINYPYGNSFSHYESSYYKDLFKELTLIILKGQVNNS